MKTLFIALSSSYVHTLLAPRYLVANSSLPVEIYETNINVELEKTLNYIINKNPDVVAFSCYIFNISYIKELLPKIKNKLPFCKIILGGYEATFNADSLINLCDFIIKGEGDFSFGQLLEKIDNSSVCSPKIIESGTVKNLDDIISPYSDEYILLSHSSKIIYMETCRGCPFGCSYCMSANTHGVRSFSLNRIISDFEKIMIYKPKLVKLVDRTFNFNLHRASKIFKFLIENYSTCGTRFHFEMAPELFNEELFSVLYSAPKNLFQFEIGVQSYKKETLYAVNRVANISIIETNLKRLISMGNIPIHVDLIAGLPFETKKDFEEGFDRLFSLKPDCLQSGFLKILKGSLIESKKDGYVIRNYPPYEIISSPCMTKEELIQLKSTTEMLDLYYNSKRFIKSIEFLTSKIKPHILFYELSEKLKVSGIEKKFLSSSRQCDLLFDYGIEKLNKFDIDTLERLISSDYLSAGNTRRWHRWIK